jgi:dipeptidase D
MNADPFAGLQPASLWQHFAEITRIPRSSGQEAAMAEYITSWAAARGFPVERDAAGNLCVQVPARPGREDGPVVVIQGHMDMVCEKDSDSPYDAETGNIHVVRDGEWIGTEGTTLGADNGIGLAAGMAAAENPEVIHGPLELLMTVDEETGLTGAMQLDPALISGRIMLNLDSEEDGVLFVGCAGGCDTRIGLGLSRSPVPEDLVLFQVVVSGLLGGHSGLDIGKNRLNAIRALVRALRAASAKVRLRLGTLQGGSKRNAIPREARATVFLAPGDEAALREQVEAVRTTLAAQYRGLDDGLTLTVEPDAGAERTAFGEEDSARVLDLLHAIPTGVVAMSQEIEGLVETSTNLGVVETDGETVTAVCCSRSSVAPALRDVLDGLGAVGRLASAGVEEHGGYPGWKPDLSSRVLAVTKQASAGIFGKEPEVTAIHAGLECGLIGERFPEMDMISFGPEIHGAHSPRERVHVPSVERFWRLLGQVLDDLSA